MVNDPKKPKNKPKTDPNDARKPACVGKRRTIAPSGGPQHQTREEREAFLSWVLSAREVLTRRMLDKPVSNETRMRAALAVIDRGLGKTPQPITGHDGGPVEVAVEVEGTVDLDSMTSGELRQRLAELKASQATRQAQSQGTAEDDAKPTTP